MARTASDNPPDVPVQVRFTAKGIPLAVRYDGRIWAVAAEPVRWFTRANWWNTAKRAPVGIGNLVDIENWKVQVRLTSTSALRTFELRRDPLSDQWLLAAISDDVDATAA
nr:hypothetical protein [Pseudarthrobacter phenanthrenivorans]